MGRHRLHRVDPLLARPAKGLLHLCSRRGHSCWWIARRIDVLLYGHVDLELAEQIQGLPKHGDPCPTRRPRRRQVSVHQRSRTTSPEGSDGRAWPNSRNLSKRAGCSSPWAVAMLPPRGRHRARGSPFIRGRAAEQSGRWGQILLPQRRKGHTYAGSHTCERRVTRASPLVYGYPAHTYVFRQNFPLYDTPRRWLRMAYCTTCLDGPEDRSASCWSGATTVVPRSW